MKPTKKKRSLLSLLAWAASVALLAALAYITGTVLARRSMMPSLALPAQTLTPRPQPTLAAAIAVDEPVEGVLNAGSEDEWRFEGRAGQTATIEMWFHPGSGSNVDAEMLVRLIAPGGTTLIEKRGSVFLPPYLFEPSLPATGSYQLQIVPLSGSPGRYSLGLSLADQQIQPARATRSSPTVAPRRDPPQTASVGFQWPSTRRAISGWTFHDPGNPGHIGLDIAAETWDPIVAAADGRVVFAEWGGGYGNLVVVEHEAGWSSYYAHLVEIAVDRGEAVRRGETLGGAGTTGHSTGPHLHFELRFRGRPVDPHVHLP